VKKDDFNAQIAGLPPEELLARREAMGREALAVRLALGGATVKNMRSLREIRRNLARLNTLIRQKELEAAGPTRKGRGARGRKAAPQGAHRGGGAAAPGAGQAGARPGGEG
jgi:large subunit ribosomal protein L29